MHGGRAPGARNGNSHALKHGRYSAEAITQRRQLTALLRDIKGLVEQVEGEGQTDSAHRRRQVPDRRDDRAPCCE